MVNIVISILPERVNLEPLRRLLAYVTTNVVVRMDLLNEISQFVANFKILHWGYFT